MFRELTWIVLADNYDEKKGGALVLHNIAAELDKLGDNVWINHESPFGVKLITEKILPKLNPENVILLCTEPDTRLNHFPNIVRFILYYPGFFEPNDYQGYKGWFSKKELIFQYNKSFTKGTNLENVPEFTPIFVDLNFWVDENKERIDQDLILHKKGKNFLNKTHIGRLLDEDPFNNQTLKDAFNKHKRFITYDNDTFHSIQAAMCGAISIVIPDGTKTEEEWRNTCEDRKWGIAFGDTKEQIEFAISTRDKLIEVMKKNYDDTKNKVVEFRNIVMRRFTDKNFFTVIIDTKWENLYLIDQLNNYKKDNNITQIIIIDRDYTNRPEWYDFEGIEIYKTNLNKIPAFEKYMEYSFNEKIIYASDKIKFETFNLTSYLQTIKNKDAIFFIDSRTYSHNYKYNGHLDSKVASEQKLKLNDTFMEYLICFRRNDYVRTPGLEEYGLNQWIKNSNKEINYIVIRNKINISHQNYNYEEIKENDVEILKKLSIIK